MLVACCHYRIDCYINKRLCDYVYFLMTISLVLLLAVGSGFF
ncbi:Uncharacterised protein [Escherichia coli]|nr:hypothetical protein EC3234A_171c00030 [Escherichia coli]SQM19105.1 Uncharacterised protein [Escherichia coli]SQN29964.1 Uncharacterised protein [Escherichia coli]